MTDESLTRAEIERDYPALLSLLTNLTMRHYSCLPFPQDFAQDVITTVWERAGEFRRECSLRTYLIRIFTYCAVKASERYRKHAHIEFQVWGMDNIVPSLRVAPDLSGVYRRELMSIIASTKLSDFQRNILSRYLNGLGCTNHHEEVELSRSLGKLRKTVRVTVARRKYQRKAA